MIDLQVTLRKLFCFKTSFSIYNRNLFKIKEKRKRQGQNVTPGDFIPPMTFNTNRCYLFVNNSYFRPVGSCYFIKYNVFWNDVSKCLYYVIFTFMFTIATKNYNIQAITAMKGF